MVSNADIRNYSMKKFGFKAKNAWIAHAKEKYGLPTRSAPNRKSKDRRWPCPKKRLEQFKEIFEHFGMI